MEMLFALFGGLAMFLYGMDRMSRALQQAAGDAMKRLLARLTATRKTKRPPIPASWNCWPR